MRESITLSLENGLNIVLHKIPHIKAISCGLWVKQGSKYENKDTNGLSHLIEHLLMNPQNSTTFTNLINDVISEGVTYNALTTKENTAFYLCGLKSTLKQCLRVLSNIVIEKKSFNNELLENEKKVIYQEALSFYSSLNQIKQRTTQSLWGNSDIGQITLGNLNNIKNATIEDIEYIINHSYTPENSTLIVVGDIDYNETFSIIFDEFSKWNYKKTRIYSEVISNKPGIYINNKFSKSSTNALSIGFRTDSYMSSERLNIEIISRILGGPTLDSRLLKSIRCKRGLAYTLGGFCNFYENRGTLGFTASCNNNVIEIINLIIDEIKEVKISGFTEKELIIAKNSLETFNIIDSNNIISRMKLLGKTSSYRQSFNLDKEIENLRKITLEDVNLTAQKIFTDENLGYAIIGNFDSNKVLESLNSQKMHLCF